MCAHVEQVEKEYLKREILLDDLAELVINVNDESDDSDVFF